MSKPSNRKLSETDTRFSSYSHLIFFYIDADEDKDENKPSNSKNSKRVKQNEQSN